MKDIIKYNLRAKLFESNLIDGQQMNAGTQSLCNTMTVYSYQDVISRIIAAIGPRHKNPQLWARIDKPLGMLAKAEFQINKEKHTDANGNYTNNSNGMTGDSIPDEANTWWSAIQTTICEQGPNFS